jgi:hypothetical protein
MPERHPDFEYLAQWQENQLAPSETAEISQHVAGCGFCAYRVQHLTRITRVVQGGLWHRPSETSRVAVFKAFSQAYAARQRIHRVKLSMAYDSQTMGPLPGLRAATLGEAHQWLYTSAEADIALNAREQSEGSWTLMGQALVAETTVREPAEVLLIAEEQIATQTITTPLGDFALEGVASGHYHIVVVWPHLRLETPAVELSS